MWKKSMFLLRLWLSYYWIRAAYDKTVQMRRMRTLLKRLTNRATGPPSSGGFATTLVTGADVAGMKSGVESSAGMKSGVAVAV